MDNKQIPRNACRMSGGEFELGDNGEAAKTAPLKMTARTGKPIEHPFWGRIVHDMSGMMLNKKRLPVDYCHMDTEVIGYLNQFDTSTNNLVVSGALIPYPANERDFASEVIYKSKVANESGDNTPLYESSIDWGGDGIQLEIINEGELVQVNGYMFEGPGVVVRQWPLRGVAVCPYGADSNTTTELSNDNQFINVKYVDRGNMQMTETNTVEAAVTDVNANATAVEAETNIPVEVETESNVNVTPDGSVSVTTVTTVETGEDADENEIGEIPESVEPTTVEPTAVQATQAAEVVPVAVQTVEAEKPVDSRTELKRFMNEFGNEHGANWFANGINYIDAQKQFVSVLRNENETLRNEVTKLQAVINTTRGEAEPVTFSESHVVVDEKKLKQTEIATNMSKKGISNDIAQLAAAFTVRNQK